MGPNPAIENLFVVIWVVLKIMGPRLVIPYITAPNILGVPKWDPNFGNYNDMIVVRSEIWGQRNHKALIRGVALQPSLKI